MRGTDRHLAALFIPFLAAGRCAAVRVQDSTMPRSLIMVIIPSVILVTFHPCAVAELFGSSPEEAATKGTLSGDVQNWATLIQNYIVEVFNLFGTNELIVILMSDSS